MQGLVKALFGSTKKQNEEKKEKKCGDAHCPALWQHLQHARVS
jgi:hypothetical protein